MYHIEKGDYVNKYQHYYNGKWNKKDLAIGISSIVLGSIAKYFITLI